MIEWLSIRHFAITGELELEFDDGFSAITGETGSGKSLMVDALAILLGGRADASLIRHGEDSAEIQCQFNLAADHPVFNWLIDNELDSNQEVLLRRVVRRDRPGRGYINGRSVNIGTLRELGNTLVDIHGQHEHHSLMRRSVQQQLLDESAGNQDLVEQVGAVYDELGSLQKQRDAVSREEASSRERIDLLTFQIGELEQLDPRPGEWDELDNEQKRIQHLHELASGAQQVVNRIDQDDEHNLNQELVRLAAQLRQLERFDPALCNAASLLEEATVNLEEAAADLNSRYQDIAIDQAEVDRIESRVSLYHDLGRKHRIQPGQLVEHYTRMRSELDSLSNPEAETARLDQLIEQQRELYFELAGKLGKTRKASASQLGKEITAAMQGLGMTGGKFQIDLQSGQADKISRNGLESVVFMVSVNPGQPVQPLAKVASGGEISRISLAIQVILASASKVPTLIFDEVDVGIGGTVANTVGERLRQLGQLGQVICVTHLAQVAARADQHFSVSKATRDSKTGAVKVLVEKLDHQQRVEEIARMTGSEKLTRQAREHAEQMLAAG